MAGNKIRSSPRIRQRPNQLGLHLSPHGNNINYQGDIVQNPSPRT
ncbi:hypothetical protein [Dyadobacter sp. CY327]|nr:hypothetical protein [Dyadobacter sp. CY327]